ncbi:MAG: flagellar filament capping protein FliD [Verrucomicrobia bacterium]|nr:flagellar filament capping protein FliD [Verrucomicrobiota bacterium]
MAGLALSGLASGFDWKGIVDQLIEVSRAPQKRMQREKAELSTRTNALNEVRSAVTTLKSSVGAIGTEKALLKKAASIANPDTKWKATAETTASAGEYDFTIKQTARAGVVRGRSGIGDSAALNPSNSLASTPLGRTLTYGFFTVNGKTINVAATDSINDVRDRIAGATGLSVSYSAGKFSILSGTTPIVLGSGADTSNFLQAMNLISDPINTEGRNSGTDLRTLVPPGTSIDLNTHLSVFGFAIDETDDGYIRINGQDIGVVPSASQSLGGFLGDLTNALGPGSTAIFNSATGQIELSSPSGIIIQEPSSGPYSDILHVFGLTKDATEDYGSISGADRATPTAVPIPYRYVTDGVLGKVGLNQPLSSANLDTAPSGPGSFYVNGAQISYDLNDTIQTILDKITASSAQVTASYDLANDAIVLTNKNTGNVGTFVSIFDPTDLDSTDPGSDTDTGGVVAALFGNVNLSTGIASLTSVTAGRDAIVTVNNGGDLTSRSNVFSETVHGIRGLSVDASAQPAIALGGSTVSEKITIKGDSSAAKEAVNDFISKYNALQSVIEKHTKVTYADGKVTAGVLAGSRELADISRSLRQSLFRDALGSGSIRRLADLGVSTSGIESTLSLSNAALLESQINTEGAAVLDFFTRSSSGLIPRLNALLGDSSTDVSAASGKIGIQLTSIQKQNTSLDKQIADLERRLESQRQLMESSFIAMERAQSKFQQQSSYLQRTFASNNK